MWRVDVKMPYTYWASRLFTANEASLCHWRVLNKQKKRCNENHCYDIGRWTIEVSTSFYLYTSACINKVHRTHKHDRRRRRAQWWVELHYWVSLLLNIWPLDDDLLDYILCWIISCVGFFLVLDGEIWKLWELMRTRLFREIVVWCSFIEGRRSGDTTTSWTTYQNHAQHFNTDSRRCAFCDTYWVLMLNLFGLWHRICRIVLNHYPRW